MDRLLQTIWLATGRIGADLSKTFSKKSLEIVLEAENLARLRFSDFGKDKTPKALDTSGFSASFIFRYFLLKSVKIQYSQTS